MSENVNFATGGKGPLTNVTPQESANFWAQLGGTLLPYVVVGLIILVVVLH